MPILFYFHLSTNTFAILSAQVLVSLKTIPLPNLTHPFFHFFFSLCYIATCGILCRLEWVHERLLALERHGNGYHYCSNH